MAQAQSVRVWFSLWVSIRLKLKLKLKPKQKLKLKLKLKSAPFVGYHNNFRIR